MKFIGIDVGGTNTDAVLLEGNTLRAAIKSATTSDITEGISTALEKLMHLVRELPSDIDAVMLGTTHFTNAVVQRQELSSGCCNSNRTPC